ncbi:TonB-dependent receptor domain-containing protein [Fundidesulfovibrio putealis]|uniref:TonB-dependent receptor domain-containing protein n=1 Tax=Fundidesulfovibrio putealis TaxID=270496 RepID=UPI0005BDEF14|nr:TonB-dependent receptor [Fundidesulfovibrio putealis]
MRPQRGAVLCLMAAALLMLPLQARAAADVAGRLIFSQGQVFTSAPNGAWEPAAIGRDLAPGDSVRTGPEARAAILCADETQIKLGANTLITLKDVTGSARLGTGPASPAAAQGRSSLYELQGGEAWLRNNNDTSKFQLKTPALTAAVRGTEFTASVGRDGSTSIALLDGRLLLSNPQGSLDLNKGELGQARPGQAPTKQMLVNPEDAVQWVLYYPTALSWRDIPLSSLPGPALTPAETAWDSGGMAQANADWTVQGFAALREHRSAEALEAFAKARAGMAAPSGRVLAGEWLAMAQAGQAVQAWEACRAQLPSLKATPGLLGVAAYLALGAGHPAQARIYLEQALSMEPSNAFCRSLLAQIDLAQNRKDVALSLSAQAVADNPDSPTAHISLALAQLSRFDLPAADRSLDKALELDPASVTAYAYKARLALGMDSPDKAWVIVQKALAIAPGDPLALTLGGFAKLGMRRFAQAQELFDRAVLADPGLPEPRLGLALVAFSRNERFTGLSDMLTATLLDPRVSLYQTSLGKAYYASRAFDKAMESYDQAARLDPADPTPHLYKGIAYTDLNQPGEAVAALNRSIELNDNRGMFRSRLLLDRDLAVRNFDLAKSYNQLGLGEWAFAKALTAVKKDPFDSSAHLFLSRAFAATRQRVSAAGSELLLYRLLSPANQNTFTLYNDYTPMFEAPYLRTQLAGGAGVWANGKPSVQGSLDSYGGVPGVAAEVQASFTQDEGLRRLNGLSRNGFAFGQFKWEPTFRDSLYAAGTFSRTHTGDVSNQNAWEYRPSLWQTNEFSSTDLELGYVRRQAPGWTFMAYGSYKANEWSFSDRLYTPFAFMLDTLPLDYLSITHRDSPRSMGNIQLQQQVTLGDHSLVIGGDVFSSILRYRMNQHFIVPLLPSLASISTNNMDHWERSITVYAMDYWHIKPNLILELGVSGEFATTPRFGFATQIEDAIPGFRFGLNWEATPKDMLRLGVQRYLNTHITLQPMLQPAEVAGFPTRVNADDGSRVVEAGISWERQWDDKTFTVLRGDFHHIENPQFDPLQSYDRKIWLITDRYLVSASVNRVLTPYLGANLIAQAKWLERGDAAAKRFPETHFAEFAAGGGLNFLYKNGIGASVSGLLVKQTFPDTAARDLLGRHRDESVFGLLNAGISYEFPGKAGFVSLEGRNLLDVKFSYQREPVALDAFVPSRQILFRLGFNF